MARRKVGNLMALAVLSVLVQRPMHPYEMASMLRARGKEADMGIKWGSLYTVVRNMEKHGLIEAVETVRQGARPERTIYRITDDGRAEMVDWVRELISVPERERTRFQAGLSVLAALAPDEVERLLRQRLALLEEETDDKRAAHERHSGEMPRLFLIENEYELALLDAELTWVRALLDELGAGTFAGIEVWRRFHETGELPAELAEMAERGSVKD
ncbi:PadR family transcriptional regulator [Allokutzneria sp. A3M-2-11 16]|uniref:PadR family transcriptional regulator n=1 Tax=Allokutzneria sp. A3M-2-11 16 TaxID=2962043 RepID=UPI0020B73942|nr:PadR family transcriptional regulator [Allokutzneria sp. A3M-2-11 16]MCP3803019.1 PadR family transcriptional regulator [Allokutzneria sp. A3M-2-11 16]